MKGYLQSFSVRFEYPVVFTRRLFDSSNPVLARTLRRIAQEPRPQIMAFVDNGVARIARQVERRLGVRAVVVPGGERLKNGSALVRSILSALIEARMHRHSIVVIVGGGAVLDAVGFAAALVHRGLRVVRVPTTALAQCDSGVGVKNAVNWGGGKNLVGTFAPPAAVLNDLEFLKTLSDGGWRDGIAEAFKVAIIKDRIFFRWLCRNAPALKARRGKAVEHLIRRCAELHLYHIQTSGDPFEQGSARPLDFGHWAAHKLETMSKYRIRHGEAVASGVALDSVYACLNGWITPTELSEIINGLRCCGLRLWRPELERRTRDGTWELWGGLRDFQEHLGGELCVTFPDGLGRRKEVRKISARTMKRAGEILKDSSC
ncbi:MAG: 3-dehydroquinate synthase [Verrucomicrobiota bacterium]